MTTTIRPEYDTCHKVMSILLIVSREALKWTVWAEDR